MVKGKVETSIQTVTETQQFQTRQLSEEEILTVLREYYGMPADSHAELRYVGADHGSLPIFARLTSKQEPVTARERLY